MRRHLGEPRNTSFLSAHARSPTRRSGTLGSGSELPYEEDAPVFKSVEDLRAKISMSLRDLDTARVRERVAQLRHAKETRPETEGTRKAPGRSGTHLCRRYRQLLLKFSRRVDARTGLGNRARRGTYGTHRKRRSTSGREARQEFEGIRGAACGYSGEKVVTGTFTHGLAFHGAKR